MKNKNKLKKFLPYAVGIFLLTFAASCGSDDDDDSNPPTTPPPQQEEQQDDGTYSATLFPVGTNVSSPVPIGATVNIDVAGDEITADVVVTGAPEGVHVQSIFTGSECPTIADDLNLDGYVDYVESIPRFGKILIPLDSDIESQLGGFFEFPSADASGVYAPPYSESGSFFKMAADLRLPDLIEDDEIVKLEADEKINLHGRVVVIHGVPTTLPGSVDSVMGLPNKTTIPIACGQIIRTTGGTTTGGIQL